VAGLPTTPRPPLKTRAPYKAAGRATSTAVAPHDHEVPLEYLFDRTYSAGLGIRSNFDLEVLGRWLGNVLYYRRCSFTSSCK